MLQKSVNHQIHDFYHHFSGKLLADYAYGNPRTEAAICHALNSISRGAKRILDVGCGIGWSSWEIKRYFPETFVLGIDISSKMIEVASKLFKKPTLDFSTHSITEWSKLFEPSFDAIVMLDVYEHIPRALREQSHLVLSRALNRDGTIILTHPSISHQTYLRNSQVSGLQPIDEDVTNGDLSKLAHDIGAHIVSSNHVDIWKRNDYVHTVIRRDHADNWDVHANKVIKHAHTFESCNKRMKRVSSCLKGRVLRDGIILPNDGGPRLCVITPNKGANLESFVRAHLEKLAANVHLLNGGWFPTSREDDKPLCSMLIRGLDLVAHKLFNSHAVQLRDRVLRRYLRRQDIQAVLAEYGPTGVHVMEACRAEGIPLIVHFHGVDAYGHPILEEFQSTYQKMFAGAEAVIAVSREMESQLLALGATRERLFYNPYGVDTSLFSGGDPGTCPAVFLSVARFVDKKAPHLTILAFKKVLAEFPDAGLIMIGYGSLQEACEQMVRALGISKAVQFQGYQSQTHIAAMMRQVRAFVQHSMRTSYGDSEGTPVAILEAGATGIPVVATRHAGIKDVVIEKKTGFLVDEGDIEGMAGCMLRLAKEPSLASRMGKEARVRICREFSMEQSICNLSKIIETAIQSHKNRHS